jgi:hypothetical protein
VKDATTGQGGQTFALAVPAEGAFSLPLAFTSQVAGSFLLCAYLNEGVGTDAYATHPIAVGPRATRPRSLGAPVIARSGARLVCSRGRWAGRPTRYAYSWRVAGRLRAGATRRVLRVGASLEGRRVQCVVRAANAAGATSRRSAAVVIR